MFKKFPLSLRIFSLICFLIFMSSVATVVSIAVGQFDQLNLDNTSDEVVPTPDSSNLVPVDCPQAYIATAYSLRGRTASGRMVSRGLIAADPRVLPLGSRVRLEAPDYSGEYLVADTGGLIRGKRIYIWTPSSREAMRFGRRKVTLTVLSYPASSPVIVRETLEKQYREQSITSREYQTRYARLVPQ